MYTKHADGFYVRAKHNRCTPDVTIKYISRYIGRPVIATSRIDEYDSENVTFHYTRHEDNKTITETVPALQNGRGQPAPRQQSAGYTHRPIRHDLHL